MHMSDALLSPIVSGVMTGISGGAAAYAVHRMNLEESGQRQLPMMAVSGAAYGTFRYSVGYDLQTGSGGNSILSVCRNQ